MELITMRDKVLSALKDVELDILLEIDRICRSHNIHYSLGGGSCLGQYRHGGIIPWDDDIDVDMVGENYDRFIEIALKELDQDKFFLRCRQTQPGHLRTSCRLEMKNTRISIAQWDKADLECGIFVDIFRWSYLPDDENERRQVASRLFFIRCAESYLMYGRVGKMLKPELIHEMKDYARNTPIEDIFAEEEQLTHCCGNEKTGWIIDDAIINGDHGGYPSQGIDEYEDVDFEGKTIMNKKNSEAFLSTIYGPNFYKWLKPADRISHHQWTALDLGEYASKYDLPEDYAYCMTLNYNTKKLTHMQDLTIEMYKKVDEICQKYNLTYCVMGVDAYAALLGLNDIVQYWKRPGIIAMPRKSYDKFTEVAQEELGKKYFYQSNETDENFVGLHSRIHLVSTHVVEEGIPKRMMCPDTDGFFIRIIPLENTSCFSKKRAKHYKLLNKTHKTITFKWINSDDRALQAATKSKMRKINKVLDREESAILKDALKANKKYRIIKKWYIDGSGLFLPEKYIPQSVIGQGKYADFCGISLMFPEDQTQFLEMCQKIAEEKTDKEYMQVLRLFERKNNKKQYQKLLKRLQAHYCLLAPHSFSQCHLNYFDIEDYQLSVWRYDEVDNRYLSIQELLGFE